MFGGRNSLVIVAVGVSVSDVSLRSLKLKLTVNVVRMQECKNTVETLGMPLWIFLTHFFCQMLSHFIHSRISSSTFLVASVIRVQCDNYGFSRLRVSLQHKHDTRSVFSVSLTIQLHRVTTNGENVAIYEEKRDHDLHFGDWLRNSASCEKTCCD